MPTKSCSWKVKKTIFLHTRSGTWSWTEREERKERRRGGGEEGRMGRRRGGGGGEERRRGGEEGDHERTDPHSVIIEEDAVQYAAARGGDLNQGL